VTRRRVWGAADSCRATLEGELLKGPVRCGLPTDPVVFERSYAETHTPLVARIPGALRTETATGAGTTDGTPAPFHRSFEFWFESAARMGASLDSPEGRAAIAARPNDATGA
jgi:uncharacterized protein (TIGR02118 family)